MSILLDALKKSEEQRQLGKVPGIHSPGGGAPVRQSRSPRWALLVLVVGSAVAVAWFGWRQFQPPQAGDLSTEETAAVATDKTASSEPAATTPDSEAPAQPADAIQVARQAAPRRTPVETLPAESASEPLAAAAATRTEPEPRKSWVNESFTAFEAGRQAAAEPQEPPAPAAAPVATAPAALKQPASKTPAPVAAPAATATQRTPAESRTTEPISFWELPQGIRDSLPDLHISVLVYAENPQDRFVLVGGQRLVEKDQLQEGVVLEEIRREGAVFLYRNYRFLVEG